MEFYWLKSESGTTLAISVPIFNDKNVTKTIDSEIYFNQNIEIVYAPRSSELQGKTKALGGYTGLIAENDDIETNTVQQYIQGVFYHLIAVEKEWKTWKQEAVQTKHTVLGIKETSGLTNWDYFPLSGSVTSVKGNRDVKLTPKEEYEYAKIVQAGLKAKSDLSILEDSGAPICESEYESLGQYPF